MDFAQGDPRYLKPAIDATDSQHLLRALVKDYRFLADLNASCVQSSVAGSTIDVLRIIAQVVGSDGQNVGMVGADPSRTDGVRRAAREPCCDHVRRGRWLRRDGPLSIHPADGLPSELLLWDGSRPGRGARAVQPHRRRLLRAAECQPWDSTNSVDFSYEFALLVETWSAAGAQEAPNNFKPWRRRRRMRWRGWRHRRSRCVTGGGERGGGDTDTGGVATAGLHVSCARPAVKLEPPPPSCAPPPQIGLNAKPESV